MKRRYRRGDKVKASATISGINVPDVPPGSVGTVVATTLAGRPKTVHFTLDTPWGRKQFEIGVHRRHIDLD
jgi:hypothetical protein